MSAFVLDCSVTLSWLLPDESSSKSSDILTETATHGAIVPALWFFEVANALLMAQRKNRITPLQRDRVFNLLTSLPIKTDGENNQYVWYKTIELAEKFQLTAYDASYLELAIRQGIPLATFDKALTKAAIKSGCILKFCED